MRLLLELSAFSVFLKIVFEQITMMLMLTVVEDGD